MLLAIVAALAAIVEGSARTDLVWPIAATVVTLALLPLLLWRRTHPLACVAIMTATTTGFSIAHGLALIEPNALGTSAVFLAVPYALFRWGSARDCVVGAVIVAVGLAVSSLPSSDTFTEIIAGIAFLGGAMALGMLRRERVESRERRLEAVRAAEREALARDLHDTVAHHVSAIVIHAQVASADPGDTARVAESLGVIEGEAHAVLADVRSLVHTLRVPADYRPPAGMEELAGLADPGPPEVAVRVEAAVELPTMVASTLYRIAQEGVANARRHARGATRVDVSITVDEGSIRLVVTDDGAASAMTSSGGHGLLGMAERAALLGGEVASGPDPAGGWTLRASIPLGGNA
ncbi:histidine kinase [Glycomyces sp. NPDC046736]|uniref:sensor histidine kinase n=1 Tax=Glycomyces sp. NPDC046736 TaxID=3155615 RepID=UPI0033DCF258